MTASWNLISDTDALLSKRQATAIGNAATHTLSADKFVFFAAFDGTNNDRLNVDPREQSTNVGALFDQVQTARVAVNSNEGMSLNERF